MATVFERQFRIKRRLTAEQVARVRALPWTRGSGRALAAEFGVSPPLISNIRRGYSYKRPDLEKTYYARATSGRERYSLGSYLTPEAAENAITKFREQSEHGLARGSIYKEKGRYRVRVSYGMYETRWEAELKLKAALAKLAK